MPDPSPPGTAARIAGIETRFQALLESVPDAMLLVDQAGRILGANALAESLFGYERAQLLGQSIEFLVPHRLRAAHRGHRQDYLRDPRTRAMGVANDLVCLGRDGAEFPVEISLRPIETDLGPLVACAIRDGTQRKAIESRYRGLVEQAHDAMLVLSEDYRILDANRQTERLLAKPRAQVIGRSYTEFVVPEERAAVVSARSRLLAGGSIRIVGRHLVREEAGEQARVPVDVSASVVSFGEERNLLFILRDVSEREAASTRVREAQQRLDHVVASSPAVLYTLRVEGRTLQPGWVSPNIAQVIGYTPDEITAEEWFIERVHPEDRQRVMANVDLLLDAGRVEREYRFRRKDGEYTWIRDEQRLLRNAQGKPSEVVGSWWNIEDRKRAELRLAESEKQYRLLFDANPHPMWVFEERSLAFLAVNDAAVAHYGYTRDEFLAMTIKDIRPPEDLPALAEDLRQRGEAQGAARVWRHRRKDGSLRLVEIIAGPITFRGRQARLVLATDVTDRQALESQLRQAQKMEAIGQLAGGVAHDFNNLLGVILGNVSLLERDLGGEHRSRKRSAEIRKAAERAADLTRQLLAFSRRQMLEPRVLDPNEALAEVESMLRRLIGEDIRLVVALGEGVGSIKADPGQIQQVIINLAVNARDAMPHGGRLLIETSSARLDQTYTRLHPDVRPGTYAQVAVSDTGHGMDRETLSHAFEPFFTTKEPGKGTGLGLATVFGIVKQSGGHVNVYSEVGYGTTFRVYLPQIDAPAEAPSAAAPSGQPSSGHETVLVVEDADALRAISEEVLSDAGYRVMTAPDPESALKMLAAPGHRRPDLLLTDIVMPGMNGRALAGRLRAQYPGLKVLFMSGYADAANGEVGTPDEVVEFIAKPFSADALLRKVRSVLDAI